MQCVPTFPIGLHQHLFRSKQLAKEVQPSKGDVQGPASWHFRRCEGERRIWIQSFPAAWYHFSLHCSGNSWVWHVLQAYFHLSLFRAFCNGFRCFDICASSICKLRLHWHPNYAKFHGTWTGCMKRLAWCCGCGLECTAQASPETSPLAMLHLAPAGSSRQITSPKMSPSTRSLPEVPKSSASRSQGSFGPSPCVCVEASSDIENRMHFDSCLNTAGCHLWFGAGI